MNSKCYLSIWQLQQTQKILEICWFEMSWDVSCLSNLWFWRANWQFGTDFLENINWDFLVINIISCSPDTKTNFKTRFYEILQKNLPPIRLLWQKKQQQQKTNTTSLGKNALIIRNLLSDPVRRLKHQFYIHISATKIFGLSLFFRALRLEWQHFHNHIHKTYS